MRHTKQLARTQTDLTPPVWKLWRGLLAVELSRVVALAMRATQSRMVHLITMRLLLCLGLVIQLGLVLLAGYLVDLSISLMDLWAELARKHLELTL
jgi:hypothetical protein